MKSFLLSIFFVFCLHLLPAQSIIHVTPAGAGTRSGNSWANALSGTDLPNQLPNAQPGTQFWIAAGTYKPTPTTDRTASFSIASGTSVYGGFLGDELTLGDRKTGVGRTIISGNIGRPDSLDNSYHLLILTNASADTHIDNLVITAGNSANVRAVQDASDFEEKGAVVNTNSNALFTNCSFINNVTYTPFGRGGGMANKRSSPTLVNCTFTENYSYLGSGMYNDDQSNPLLINCLFTKNRATQGAEGSALYSRNNSQPTLRNCTLTQNVDNSYSGPIGTYNSPLPVVINCIFWNNTGTPRQPAPTDGYRYSLVQDPSSGTGNINANPLFVDPANGDFRLRPGSPAINAGDPNRMDLPTTDLAGQARVQGGRVDMGAYEFVSCPNPVCLPVTVVRNRQSR